MSDPIEELQDALEAIAKRMRALERRVAGQIRHGPVKEVDTEAKTVRLTLNDPETGEEFLSAPVPYAQHAAPGTGYKEHIVPVVGQNMTLLSPTGDIRQGVAMPMTWSDQAESPGTDENPVETYGHVKKDMKADYSRTRVKDTRVVTREGDKTYAKFRCGDQFFVVTKDKIICSMIPEVGEDPDPEM